MRNWTGAFNQMSEAFSVRRVFGEPIERDGATLIPVARLRGGWGAGGGLGRDGIGIGEEGARPGSGEEAPAGGGIGGLVGAQPVGVYVIKDGEVTWLPAVDANRAVTLGCVVAVVFLLTMRSVIRACIGSGRCGGRAA